MSGGAVSLIVINYGTPGLVEQLLRSLADNPDRDRLHEIILVDNGYPEKGDLRTLVDSARYPVPLQFIANRQHGYASGVNRGAAAATGTFLALANSDVAWRSEPVLAPLQDALEADPQAAAAGPQLLYEDGSWQRSFGGFPSVGEALRQVLLIETLRSLHRSRDRSRNARPVDALSGAFFLVRRAVFEDLKGFDESFEFYGEDIDFFRRLAGEGRRRLLVPAARLTHIHGASSRQAAPIAYLRRQAEAQRRLVARWHGETAARWYRRLLVLAAAELAVVYSIVSRVHPSARWKQRAAGATNWLIALRSVGP